MSDFSHESALLQHGAAVSALRSDAPQHLAAHTRLTYSVIHTPLWQDEHTLFIHTRVSLELNTHTHTPLTDLTPTTRYYIFAAPSSLHHGCYSRHRGVFEMPQSAKKPPSLRSKLAVIVVCCCANVLRGSLLTAARGEVQQ